MNIKWKDLLPSDPYEWAIGLIILGLTLLTIGIGLEIGGYEDGIEGGTIGLIPIAAGVYVLAVLKHRRRESR